MSVKQESSKRSVQYTGMHRVDLIGLRLITSLAPKGTPVKISIQKISESAFGFAISVEASSTFTWDESEVYAGKRGNDRWQIRLGV